MSPRPVVRHGNECRCLACKATLKQQYHADMDGASHWAIRTTRSEDIDPLLDLSVRLMAPAQAIKERNEELRKELAERDRIILAILHGTDRLRDDIEGATWPDEIYSDTLAKLKAFTAEDAERRGMRA